MIVLENGWVIDADENNFILCKINQTTDKKTDKQVTNRAHAHYYRTLEGAMQCYYRQVMLEAVKATNLGIADLVKKLNEITKELNETINRITKGVKE